MLIINLLIYGKWDLFLGILLSALLSHRLRALQIRENRFQFSDPFLHKFHHFKEKILLYAFLFLSSFSTSAENLAKHGEKPTFVIDARTEASGLLKSNFKCILLRGFCYRE